VLQSNEIAAQFVSEMCQMADVSGSLSL
jgi:hypothetical protein